jgi:phosphopantetheine--protein transferase-like protein
MRIRGVGIDVADTRRFVRLLERHGDGFTSRWFTAAEVAECAVAQEPGGAGGRALAARYAAKYAAKEAVWKALGPEDWQDPLPWRGIAVLDDPGRPGGHLRVVLTGAARRLAERLGVDAIEVSLCRTGPDGPALAIAVAGRTERLRG